MNHFSSSWSCLSFSFLVHSLITSSHFLWNQPHRKIVYLLLEKSTARTVLFVSRASQRCLCLAFVPAVHCRWQHFPAFFCGSSSFSLTTSSLHQRLPLSVLFISNVSLSAPLFFPANFLCTSFLHTSVICSTGYLRCQILKKQKYYFFVCVCILPPLYVKRQFDLPGNTQF